MQLLAADGRTLQVNKAWQALWEISDESPLKAYVLGSDYNVLTDPQLRAKGITPYLDRAFAGESVKIPAIHYDPAELGRPGRPRWVTAKAHPMKDTHGCVLEVMLMHEDITDRMEADQLLRHSEERFRSLVSATSQMVWTTDAQGLVVEDSASWRAFTGQSYDEWKGTGWTEAIHPDDREHAARSWMKSVEQRTMLETEFRVRHVGGGYRWTSVRAVPVLDDDGLVREWIGSNTDIHEVKLAEGELEKRLAEETRNALLLQKVAKASQTLHSALAAGDIARIQVDEVRDILEVHQAVVSLTEGENWAQAINAVSLSEKYAEFRAYDVKTDGSGIYATVCGTNKPMRLTQAELERHPGWKGFGKHGGAHPPMRGWLAVPLIGHDGKNLGLIQVSDRYEADFTEQDEAILTQLASIAATGFENARLYVSLKEQDRRKDEFLAMLAHELRNPLAPIGAAAELLKFANLDRERMRQTSEVIGRQVEHMTGLVNDLLDVSRVTRGLITLEKELVNFSHIVTDALEQVGPLVRSRRHQLTLQLSSEAVTVYGDSKRLVQVITNILANAAKYTPEGGTILLQTQARLDQVILRVVDNGIGMTPELTRHAFDLFTQGARSSDRSSGGLGLGLALVKSLVELHDGTVTCFSDGMGKGSTFTVILPRQVERNRISGPGENDRHFRKADKTLKVMVVDDNADAANMLAMFLEALGHEVLVEHKAVQALQRARAELPQVCILDIGLPDIDGTELARQLRSDPATGNMVLIAVTGYGQEQDREKSRAAGFDHHLVKPVDMSKLMNLLD